MEKDDKVHIGQRFYDNIFLLFVLGNLLMLVIYDIWGMMDIMAIQ